MAFTPAVLSRRRLLQLGVGAGAGLLAACRTAAGPELLLAPGCSSFFFFLRSFFKS